MKRGKSGVAIAVVLIAAMLLTFVFAACVVDEGCKHANLQHVAAVDATCVDVGNVEYWHCPDCDKYFSDSTGKSEIERNDTIITATGVHDWGVWVTDIESSCTTGGTRHRVCNDCGERQEETLPIGKHDLIFVQAEEATCTEEGNVAYWHCSVCGKDYSDESGEQELTEVTTPKVAHDMTHTDAVSATCTTEGNAEYWHCSICDKNYSDEAGAHELTEVTTPKVAHDMTHVAAVDATCIDDGNVEYWHCLNCGKYFSDSTGKSEIELNDTIIAATGKHVWGEWTMDGESSCTTGGMRRRVCDVCGETQEEVVPAGEHDMIHVAAADATCVSEGNVEYWQR